MNHQKRKRKIWKNAVSILLCIGMVTPYLSYVSSVPSRAVAAQKEETVCLESSRLPAEQLPEGDWVYFGTAAASVGETGEYSVRIYREGNLDKTASVEVRTLDMTAVYGEDYELEMDGVERCGDGKSLLEKYVKGQITEENKRKSEDLAGSGQEETPENNAAGENASGEEADSDGGVKASQVSTLAADKERQTGTESRKLQDTEEKNFAQSVSDALVSDAMENMAFSSTCTVAFEPGEREKVVKFRILEDAISEGTEGFSLFLANARGAEVFSVTTCAVSIADDERAERSRVSFAEAEYSAGDGKAVLTVKRTGALYSVCDMRIRTVGDTAKAGVNYEETDETVAFAPYETEKKIEIAVAGSGRFAVMLTDLKACEKGEYAECAVEIAALGDAGTSGRLTKKAKKSSDSSEGGTTAPKMITYEWRQSQTVDVPLMGKLTAGGGSGLLTFGKTWWDDEKTGYTLQIGLDGLPGAAADTQKKIQKYNDFQRMAAGEKSEKTDSGAQNILFDLYSDVLPGGEAGTGIAAEKKATQDVLSAIRQDTAGYAGEPRAGLSGDAWDMETAFVLAFDFVYNPVKKEYMFSCGSVAAGGTYSFQKTAYTMVSTVPAYVSFAMTMQADYTDFYKTKNGDEALTADEFVSYSGNLAEKLGASDSALSLTFSGKARAGSGIGVVSPRGYVTYQMQFDNGGSEASPSGAFVSTAGGFNMDLMLFSVDFNMCSAAKGWGCLEGREDEILKKFEDGQTAALHSYTGGTSDMDTFGRAGAKKIRGEEDGVAMGTLIDGAVERTRPKIIPLDEQGDEKMIVFLGNGSTQPGDTNHVNLLYYSIYDGLAWGQPKIVANDGTADSMPDVVKAGGKVFITWSDAARAFTEEDSNIDRLNLMGISMAVYDIASGTMGEEITLCEDKYLNLAPQVTADDTNVYVYFMKRDLSRVENETDLFNFENVYSAMAYRTYNYQTNRLLDEYEKYCQIYHIKFNNDPLVTDYMAAAAQVGGDTYSLATYTIDEDGKLGTEPDKEVYLLIRNETQDKNYYPIRVTEDAVGQGLPKLTEVDGVLYLTWIGGGSSVHLMNVTEILTALFDTSQQSPADKTVYINGRVIGSGSKNVSWYQKGAEELGMTAEQYNGSIYEDLANGNFHIASTDIADREGRGAIVSSYTLTGKGDNLYVFYTDFGPEEDKACVELYGVKYQKGADGESGRFGKAVQITDKDKVIDEISLYMEGDGRIEAVSNYYEQWIDDAGSVQYGANKLVEMGFDVGSGIGLGDDAITLPARLVAGEKQEIAFEVKNNGLADASGFSYTVSQVTGGTETVIGEEATQIDTVLESGGSMEIRLPWTVPDNLADTSIKVCVRESGGSGTVESICPVPCKSRLSFERSEILREEDGLYVEAVITNVGNMQSEEYEAVLKAVDGTLPKEYGKVQIPVLASGEKYTVKMPFTVGIDDFSDLGIMNLELSVLDGEKTVVETGVRFASSTPVCAQIEDGSKIEIPAGKTAEIKVKAAPWNELAGTVQYTSSDSEVAEVDETGIVIGKKEGTATIKASYPGIGLETSVDVEVLKAAGTPEPGTSPKPTETPEPTKGPGTTNTPGPTGKPGETETPPPGMDTPAPGELAGTKKIVLKKKSLVVAPGKSVTVPYSLTVDAPRGKSAADVTLSVSGNTKISAVLQSGKVQIKVDKKAVRGTGATVTLGSKNADGKKVQAAIKVKVQNKTKKLSVKKKSLTLKKGAKRSIALKVTAQNNKYATTDTVKITSRIVSLAKASVKKKKVTLTLKGKKKGSQKVVIRVGSKKVKVKVKVK